MKKKVFTNEDGVYAIKQYIDGTHEGKLFFNAKMVTHFCTKLYPDIDKNEIHSVIKYCLEYLTEKEAVKLLEKGTGIIYFGFSGCPWCRNLVPILTDLAEELEEPVYYLDILFPIFLFVYICILYHHLS